MRDGLIDISPIDCTVFGPRLKRAGSVCGGGGGCGGG